MTFDAAARLADGRPAVANTQTYVSACHAVGYQHPDLTTEGAGICEWYGTEDGLDLDALDADCAALQSAAHAAEEGLRVERDGLGALAAAWQGGSADAAADFVDRHCEAGAGVVASLRSAADSCAALRDNLWRLIGGRVEAAVTIDDRRAGQRAAWLAAAQTVMTGVTDRTAAADVVKQQIIPYVDGDIRTDWVGAMRSATDSVATAYDDVIHRINACAAARFEVPTQLGPLPPQAAPPPQATSYPATPVPASPSVAPPAPTGMTAPAALPVEAPQPPVADSPLPPAVPALPPPEPMAAPSPQGTDLPAGVSAGPAAGLPGAGVAAPDLGGGLSGLIGQIADAFSGLLDGSTGTPPESSAVDAGAADPPDPADLVDDGEGEGEVPGEAPDEKAANETKDEEPVEDSPADEVFASPTEPPPPAGPVVAPAPAPPQAPPPPEPTADAATPCEIAADELAQVGQ